MRWHGPAAASSAAGRPAKAAPALRRRSTAWAATRRGLVALHSLFWLGGQAQVLAQTQPAVQPLPAPAQAQPPTPPGDGTGRLEANLLVLEVRLDGHVLSDGLNAYLDGHHLLLPLGELARLLTLGISVRPQDGTASGFVLREAHAFGLRVADATVQQAGREQVFENRLAVVIGDDIYVSSQLLSRWLPVDLDLDLPTLQLRVRARQRLPLQERLARASLGAQLVAGPAATADPGHDRVLAPLRWISMPAVDQTFGAQLRLGDGPTQPRISHTAYLTGDLLGMEAAAFVASRGHQLARELRLVLGRHDPDAGLLGPLQARAFQLGHISLPGVPLLMSGGARGLGWLVNNRPLDQPAGFDRHSLRGDLPPGWDVTLYYNDALVRFQPSRDDGLYAFDDLPLAWGLNDFRLVFNGPLGQTRVERQRYLLDQAVVRPGQWLYTLAQQRDGQGGLRTVAQVDLGLTRNLTANASALRQPTTAGTSIGHGQLGLRGHWRSVILNGQVSTSQAGGLLVDLGAKAMLGSLALDLQHLHRQARFESPLLGSGAAGLRNRHKLGLSGALAGWGGPPLSFSLEGAHDVLGSGDSTLRLQGRASVSLQRTSLSNTLRWHSAPGLSGLDGSLQLSRRLVDIGLNAQLDYSLRPQAALQGLAITADHNLADGYRIHAGLLHTRPAQTTQITGGLSRQLGSFGLAVNGSLANGGGLALSLQLFMGLGRDPRAGSWSMSSQPQASMGAVSARVFVDSNHNGVHDPGEELVRHAGFIINNSGRHPSRTDAQGLSLLGRLTPGQHVDIAIDPATLDDPQWRPLAPGVRVLPRPGLVQEVEFPVVQTTEIDGTVYLLANGQRRGIADVRIELVDDSGRVLDTATSASDGFYLLHQVLPGRRTLRVAPGQAAKLRLGGVLSRPLEVAADGDFISGQDFELQWQGR